MWISFLPLISIPFKFQQNIYKKCAQHQLVKNMKCHPVFLINSQILSSIIVKCYAGKYSKIWTRFMTVNDNLFYI
jgi:hypothetical protein